jgi:hypothetical protein
VKGVSFTVMLTPEDRYRHEHLRFRTDILGFAVQYETKVEGKWLPVVRYDTRHGFAHRDLLDRKGEKQKTPLFARDFNEALTFAEHDIKSNWRIYKQRFLRGG